MCAKNTLVDTAVEVAPVINRTYYYKKLSNPLKAKKINT